MALGARLGRAFGARNAMGCPVTSPALFFGRHADFEMWQRAAQEGNRGSGARHSLGRILDRIVAFHVEAKHVERLPHVLRQGRGDIERAARRMRQD